MSFQLRPLGIVGKGRGPTPLWPLVSRHHLGPTKREEAGQRFGDAMPNGWSVGITYKKYDLGVLILAIFLIFVWQRGGC